MNAKTREPMGADLLRQRRNLLVISLGLVAVKLAGAKFKKEISIFGAGLEFEHPERLLVGAWVLWAYFLLRYLQYLLEDRNWGITDGIKTYIKRRQFESVPHQASNLTFTGSVWFQWQLMNGDFNNDTGDMEENPVGPENSFGKAWWTVCAFTYVAIKTPRFTDYLLPILVACMPLALKALDWATSV